MRHALSISVILAMIFGSANCLAAEPETSAEKKDPVLMYREAGASEEQETKIRQLAQEYEKAARVKIERLKNLSLQIKELSYQPELDEGKLLAVQNEINELQNWLSSERLKLMFKIRALFSIEQKTKLVELMKEKDQAHPTVKAH